MRGWTLERACLGVNFAARYEWQRRLVLAAPPSSFLCHCSGVLAIARQLTKAAGGRLRVAVALQLPLQLRRNFC